MNSVRVAVPDDGFADRLRAAAEHLAGVGVEVEVWRIGDPAPEAAFDLLVLPYMIPAGELRGLPAGVTRVVQSQTLGFDGVAETLAPGLVYCNAVGVHEASTAELVLGLLIADRRGFPDFAAAQREHRWAHARRPGLAGSRVLVIGVGGVGDHIRRCLEPFDVDLVRVARNSRTDAFGSICGTDELPRLLAEADAVVLAVPLNSATRHLVNDEFLGRMKDGALLVNVARGPVVDTAALLEHLRRGRLRAALDVVDPEPLPPDHPLWTAPHLVLTPHVGGHTDAMTPRIHAVVAEQIRRLHHGLPPANVVLGGS